MTTKMSERDFYAEAVEIVTKELCVPNPKWLTDDRARPAEKLAVRECERNLRGDDLIRQMVEMMSRGYGNIYGWIKAAEKYLEYQKEILEDLQHDQ